MCIKYLRKYSSLQVLLHSLCMSQEPTAHFLLCACYNQTIPSLLPLKCKRNPVVTWELKTWKNWYDFKESKTFRQIGRKKGCSLTWAAFRWCHPLSPRGTASPSGCIKELESWLRPAGAQPHKTWQRFKSPRKGKIITKFIQKKFAWQTSLLTLQIRL